MIYFCVWFKMVLNGQTVQNGPKQSNCQNWSNGPMLSTFFQNDPKQFMMVQNDQTVQNGPERSKIYQYGPKLSNIV